MDLAFLSPLTDRPGPWASVYFDTSRTSESAAWDQEVAARNACDELEQQGAVRRADTRYLGDPHPVPARADDALLRSAVATGAEVVRIPGPAEGGDDLPVGGLGALLRWPESGRQW
jgi:hypothetical protein